MERFTDAFQYTSGIPIKKLAFEVTIFRAPVSGEADATVIAQKKIHWGQKLPNPVEAMHWFDLTKIRQNQEEAAKNGGPAVGAPIPTLVDNAVAVEALKKELEQYPSTADPNTLKGQVEQLMQHITTAGRLYTMPPSVDWINSATENSQLEPEQDVTPLSGYYLRQHREKKQSSPFMHICFALGYPDQPKAGQQPVWKGDDVTVTTLKMQEDGVFSARPSLGEPHTLFVDAMYLYTFLVTVASNQNGPMPLGGAQAQGSNMDTTALLQRQSDQLLSGTSFRRTSEQLKKEGGGEKSLVLEQSLGMELTMQQSMLTGPTGPTDTGAATRAEEREKLALLKQVIRTSQASGKTKRTIQDFAKPPHSMKDIKLHVMGTIERVRGVQRDHVFLRVTLQPPVGATEDTKVNQRTGVNHMTTIVSQVASASRMRNDDNMLETVHTFNFPFEFHLTLPEDSSPAQLNVEVFSGGFEGSYETAEGYTCIRCIATPGSAEGEVGMWLPRATGYERLKSMFIGGGQTLAHTEDVSGIQAGITTMDARKAGLVTDSTGHVEYRMIRIVQQRTPAMTRGISGTVPDSLGSREQTPRTPRGRKRM